ncbi:MAG: hypothetical protein ACOC5M_03870 [Chloroflexota bacterium]
MLQGALLAFGIIVVSLAIPVVHFVAGPVSPFVAGFFGGGVAKADEGKIVSFGLLVAGMMVVPAAAAAAFSLFIGDIPGFSTTVVVAIAVAIIPYVWFGVTVGALVSYLLRRRESGDAGGQ